VVQAALSASSSRVQADLVVSGNLVDATNPLPTTQTVLVGATFARPADTTPYAAKDSVNSSTSAPAVMTFTNALRVTNGSGYITRNGGNGTSWPFRGLGV
jgi:hypothetical protein